MEKRHRIFIAINLPGSIKKQLASYEQKWPDFPAKWTNRDNIHITLEFLGYIIDEELGEVCRIAKEVAERHNAFSINLNKISYAPPGKIPPRMIWAEGDKSKELSSLKNDMKKSLVESVRINVESRVFSPHITLARISAFQWKAIEPEERPEIEESIDLVFTVESIEIMESVLKKGGPEYTILESHNLGT